MCLVMVLVIFAPFVLFNSSSKAKKDKTKLKDILAKHNLKIDRSEAWGNSYVGIDENQKKIIFLKFSDLETNEQLLDSYKIRECTIVENRKNLNLKDKKESLLEKLSLKVLFNNGDTTDLVFYDAALNYKEDFELKRIQNWKSQIGDLITKKVATKKVA